jgi:hypothetical protein
MYHSIPAPEGSVTAYQSEDGRIRIVQESPRRWMVNVDGKLWGDFAYRDRFDQGHDYRPFGTLTDAMENIGHSEFKGMLFF